MMTQLSYTASDMASEVLATQGEIVLIKYSPNILASHLEGLKWQSLLPGTKEQIAL